MDRSGVLEDLVRVLDAGCDEVLDALEGVQFGEWLVQVVAGDVLFLDEEFDEDRLVECAALFVGAAFVEFLGVCEEFETFIDEDDAYSDVFNNIVHPCG